jgi:hypothetical protein
MSVKTKALPTVTDFDELLVNGRVSGTTDAARISKAAAVSVLTSAIAPFVASGGLSYATYSAMAADTTRSANQYGIVPSDTGTHTDPVVGGTVNNAGVYSYSTSPAGWRHVADMGLSNAQVTTIAHDVARAMVPKGQNLLQVYSGQYPGELGWDWQMDTQDNPPMGMAGWTMDNILNSSGGLQSQTGAMVSDFVPVTPGGKITCSALFSIVYYDINKLWISGANTSSSQGEVKDVPSNAYYLRCVISSFRDANRNTHKVMILEGDQTVYDGVTRYPHPWETLVAHPNMFRPWAGKVWSIQGDSIGADWMSGPWAVEAAKYHGCPYIKVEARPGNTVDGLNTRGNGSAGVALADSYYDDVDAIVCIIGSNDAANFTSRPIGAITDATTANTFYGWYKKFIEARITYKPICRIIMATILQRGGGVLSETSRTTFNNAIREIAAFYGCHLWDIGTYGNYFSPFTFSMFSSDDTHLEYRHWGIIDGGHPRVVKDVATHLVLGNNFKGLMHSILPADFVGAPILTERDDDQIYFIRRVPG